MLTLGGRLVLTMMSMGPLRLARSRATILLYHGVGACPSGGRPHLCMNVSSDVFAAQIAFLVRRRRVVSLTELLAEPEGPAAGGPTVAISFDDGYRSVLTEALPVLRRHHLPATVFVPTRWIGDWNRWTGDHPCSPLPLMSESELRVVDSAGIRVESHGHAHLDLRTVSDEVVRQDLRTSVEILERVIGRRPQYLAYPFGTHSPRVEAIAAQTGFSAVLTAFHEGAGGTPGFAHERVDLDGRESPLRLWLKTRGGYPALRRSRAGAMAATAVRRVVRRPVADPPG
jgi:peptidoglycan/xylan/chitin deacetylase (PgdA/CDA1 family)